MTQDQVEKFISQYLNQATRHNFENLTIRDFKSFDCEMNVEVAHTIHIKAIEDTSREPKGELLTKGDYESAKQIIISKESSQWINKLEKHILGCKYGNYSTQKHSLSSSSWLLLRPAAVLSYQKPCHKCGGKGSVTCNDCKGKGQVKCSSCSGRRRTKCSKCSGQGRLKKTRYKLNGEKYIAFDECSSCKGYGTVVCSKCDAHGVVDCSKCKSSGIVNCSLCYATGRITTNVEFAAYVDTKYYIKIISENQAFDADKILQEIPKAKLNQGEHERLELAQSVLGVKERYKITLPVAQCTIELDSKSFVWSFYGREIQLASDDHCVSYILQADVENLQKTARFCYLKPFILWQAKEPIKNFMDSPINEAVLLAVDKEWVQKLKECKKDEQSKKLLSSALKEITPSISFEHFSNSILAMLSIIGAYFFYSQTFWLLVAGILGAVCFEYQEQIIGWVAGVWAGAPYVHYFIFAPSLILLFGSIWRRLLVKKVWGKKLIEWLYKMDETKQVGLDFRIGFFGLVWIVLEIGWHYLIN